MRSNPCVGVWWRKSTYQVIEDSWGRRETGERYWSTFGDYNPETGAVRLHPYSDTIKDARRMFNTIMIKEEFLRENFIYAGRPGDGRWV